MNALQRSLVSAGLAEAPKSRRRRKEREFKCKKCGQTMYRPENTNIVACECGNYIVFGGEKNA